jgi:hypothetical protein
MEIDVRNHEELIGEKECLGTGDTLTDCQKYEGKKKQQISTASSA